MFFTPYQLTRFMWHNILRLNNSSYRILFGIILAIF